MVKQNILKNFTKSTGKDLYQSLFLIRDDIHMTAIKLFNVHNHLPACPSTSKILPPAWHWTSSFKRMTPSLQMITNELKENIIQVWLLYFIGSFLQVAFVFSFNSLILPGFPLTSFHLAETSLSVFSWLYTVMCVAIQNITKCLLFIIIHIFSIHVAVNLFYLHNLKT